MEKIIESDQHTKKNKEQTTRDKILAILSQCPMVVTKQRTTKYLNDNQDWENSPRLYFGMGGGS